MESIESVERCCLSMYESRDGEERREAERVCEGLCGGDRERAYSMCILLLERASSHYSQLVAISTLTKLVYNNQPNLSVEQRLEIRNMCLNYLLQRDNLVDFVVRGMVSLICKITKLGWLDMNKEDSYPFREIISPLMDMIKTGQPSPILMGVQVLYGLVYEFNQSYEGELSRSTIVMRKIANNFRDNQLLSIFQVSVDLLGRMFSNIKSLNLYDGIQHAIVQYSLKLTLACLSYDFIGTSGGEEASDDMTSVQVPTNWRQAFLSPSGSPDPVPLFFQLFETLPANLGHLALSCLVQTASFRRSFFNNSERQTFLGQLTDGVLRLLSANNEAGVSQLAEDITCYHELCRLLCRLKSNFQLGELVALATYPRFIGLLTKFTVSCFDSNNNLQQQQLQSTDNCQHYLLVTWQRLVASLPYLRCQQPHLLDSHCPTVLEAYISSRLRTVSNLCHNDNSMTPLSHNNNNDDSDCGELDSVSVAQELDSVAVLSRCQYPLTVTRLVTLFDAVAGRFSSCCCGSGTQQQQQQLKEAVTPLRELCWLVLFMGACISGRVACAATSDDSDRLDGELVSRVLQLANVINSDVVAVLLQEGGHSHHSHFIGALATVELAIVAFLDQTRRVYLCGETSVRAQALYQVLQSRVSVSDDSELLETLLHKLLLNLRSWSRLSRTVIGRTLSLLHELSMGAVAKRLMKLPIVLGLLEHHSPLQLPFLQSGDLLDVAFSLEANSNRGDRGPLTDCVLQLTSSVGGSSGGGCSNNSRTSFYSSLTRLFLLSPQAEDSQLFLKFMEPLTEACDSLTHRLGNPDLRQRHEADIKLTLLGLIRDVRGVSTACHSKAAFQTQFEWLFPAMFSHLLVAIDLWGPTEPWGLTLGCLKLVAELSLSRNNRLQPQVTSPSGELMFRVCSRVLICYGEKITHDRLVSIRNSKTHYLLFIKEATSCIDILRNLLTGNYVNLGAFALYADDSLEKCLQVFLKLMVSVLAEDLMSYPKLARSYYCLADSLTQDHLTWLGTQDPQMVLYFVNTLCDGLLSTSLAVSSSSCSSLDNLVTFLLRLVTSSSHTLPQSPSLSKRPLCLPAVGAVGGGLSDTVRGSLENFLLTSQHLSARDRESQDTWRRLLLQSPAPQASPLVAVLARSTGSLLQALMEPECKNQWAMSRPLLGLILLNQKAFEELQLQLCGGDRDGGDSGGCLLRQCFSKLMEDVNCTLSVRNRDKFTQNLNTFRHSLSNSANTYNNNNNKVNIEHSYNNNSEMIA